MLVDGEAKIIDISSGVCTVGYASHEQLIKLNVESYGDSQKITDALEQVCFPASSESRLVLS